MIDRNTWIMYGILALVLFFGGFIVGYLTWGAGAGDSVDYKALLKDAAGYIAKLENENSALSAAPNASADQGKPAAPAAEAKGDASAGEAAVETAGGSESQEQNGAARLADHSAALMAALDEEKNLAQRHVVLTEKLQSVMEAQQALEADNVRLQAVVSEKDKLMSALEQSKAEAQDCLEQKEQLTLAKAELEANINRNQALIDQNEGLQVQLKKMTGDIDAMRSRLVEIQSIAGVEEGGAPEPPPEESPKNQSQEQPAQ